MTPEAMDRCLNATTTTNVSLGGATGGGAGWGSEYLVGWNLEPLSLEFVAAPVQLLHTVVLTLSISPYILACFLFVTIFPATVAAPAFLRWARNWLRKRRFGKAMEPERDVWTIHGRSYDLTPFLPHHPGGEWSLRLAKNRDCTALFESYHFFIAPEKLAKIMARYEILGENPPPPGAPAAPPESCGSALVEPLAMNKTGLPFGDAFHEDVKHMVRKHFEGQPRWAQKMKPSTFAMVLVLLAAHWTGVWGFLADHVWAVVTLPVTAWLLTGNVSHEASHFALSRRPWLNQLLAASAFPLGFNSTAWHLEHCVQHHVYTNTECDVDLYHFLPLVRASRLTRHMGGAMRLQNLMIFLLLPTTMLHLGYVVPQDLLTGHVDAVTGVRRYNHIESLDRTMEEVYRPMLLELTLMWGWFGCIWYAHGFAKGFVWMALSYTILSWLFVFFTQGAHLQARCFQERKYRSWADRQASTALDFKPLSRFWHLASGGLNVQSLHHLIPGVSASHLLDLYPKYQKLFEKHGIEVQQTEEVSSFFGGFFAWIRELAEEEELPPIPCDPQSQAAAGEQKKTR